MSLIVPRSRLAKANKPKLFRLTTNERGVVNAFKEAVNGLPASIEAPALAAALSARNVGAAVQAFDWGTFGTRLSTVRLQMLTQMKQSGMAEARELGSVIGHWTFDITDPRAIAWAATRSGQLVVNVSNVVRGEIREIITSSFTEGINPREIIGLLERQVGLFPRWAQAVENQYDRNLRDFQLKDGLPWTEAQSKAMGLAEQYRDRLIGARAENIARTEIITASNQGRYMSWLQAADAGLVDLENSSKEWVAEGDACPICDAVDGPDNAVMVLEDWTLDNGDTVSMPPGHPSCRCSAVLLPGELPSNQLAPATESVDAASLD